MLKQEEMLNYNQMNSYSVVPMADNTNGGATGGEQEMYSNVFPTDDPSPLSQINTDDLLQFSQGNIDFQNVLEEVRYIPSPLGEPDHWTKVPSLQEIESEYQFEVNLNSENSGKNSWVYSSKLRKVFIKMESNGKQDHVFTVQITYKPLSNDLQLRTMLIFTDPANEHSPVIRCKQHRTPNEEVSGHMLRCTNSNTIYCGDESKVAFGERLSLVLPMPRSSEGVVQENLGLSFLCQSSCATGINRRATAIVFCLENAKRQIVGKRVMQFKVCSCPKRDKGKEEESEPGSKSKRKASDAGLALPCSSGKRPLQIRYLPVTTAAAATVKEEPNRSPAEGEVTPELATPESAISYDSGTAPVTLQLTLPNADAARHVLRTAENELWGQLARLPPQSKEAETINRCLATMQTTIEGLNQSLP